MKVKWEIVHDCDDGNGNPTQWAAEINHPDYGRYCWINDAGTYYNVEIDNGDFEELA